MTVQSKQPNTPEVLSTLDILAGIPVTHIWKLTVEQYHKMIATGTLTEDDPVELLEGWLVTKMFKDTAHRTSTRLARGLLEPLVPNSY
ncbi:MAG: hypothetical protein ACRCYY_16965 [Trueperaceae bacterium]